MTTKISIVDLEQALKYLKTHSTAFCVHIKQDDVSLHISTVDASGHALELILYDADKSQSKAKVVQTEVLDTVLAKVKRG